MGNTKEKILAAALELFNNQGVADVSIRHVAKETDISHGNLIYHFKNKSEIVEGLHQQLFEHAARINQNIRAESLDISQLYQSTQVGFEVVYDFRFLFYDLLYISKTFPGMRETLILVEKVRSEMYGKVIHLSIKNELLRAAEYEGEYEQLIRRIKIFSDHWLSSAAIYENKPKEQVISEYAGLLMNHFYPYLTGKGKEEFRKQGLV